MKQRLILMVGIVLFVVVVLYAQYATDNYREQGGARTVIGGELDIVSGGELSIEDGGALYLVPTDTEPASTEGYIYFDLSESTPKYHNGATFVSFASGSGDNTLNLAYDEGGDGVGRTITADTGAVVITNTDADAAYLLEVTPTPGSSAATGGIQITSGALTTQDSLNIVNSGTGDDIEAGNGAFTVSSTGVLVALEATIPTLTVSTLLTASNGITLATGGTITNDTPNEIEFTDNSEELSMVFTSNTITWATDTSMDAMAFGDVDDLSGIGSIAFDAAASTITLAADGANDDLTIQVTNATDSSLVLQSSGTTADAFQIITTAGGIDITNGGAPDEDIDIAGVLAAVNITSAEAAGDAIVIQASDAAGGIDLIAGTGNVTIVTAGAGGDVDIDAAAGSVYLDGGQADAKAIWLAATDAAGGVTIDFKSANMTITGTGASADFILDCDLFSIDGIGSANISVTGAGSEDLTISQLGGDVENSVHILSNGNGADAITIKTLTNGGGIDILADGDVGGAGDIDITNTNGSIIITSGENAVEAIYIHANKGVAETIKIHADQGNTATSIHLLSDAGGITLNAAGGDIEFVTDMDVNADIIGDGGGDIIGMTSNVEAYTEGGNNITIEESGKIFTNSGDADGSLHTLPEASTAIGCRYTFVVLAAQNLVVDLDGSDVFLHLTLDAGDKITSATAGDTITVIAVDDTNWVILSVYPTASDWADGGP